MRQVWIITGCTLIIVNTATTALASIETIGPNGISSAGLTLFNGMPLNGDGVRVGQVEDLRPALPGYDNPNNSNSNVVPAGIFIQDGGNAPANMNLGSGHGTWVAGVIISTDATDSNMNGDAPLGVAPMAELHASAYVTQGASLPAYRDYILSTQYIANSVGAQVINHSASKAKLAANDLTDGNSQLTLGIDWIAQRYDTLNVVLGYQGVPTPSGRPFPTDNFNGMTIGRSAKIGNVYRAVSTQNNFSEDATGERTSVSLLAPGDDLEIVDVGDTEAIANGTSFAAPHVTGTVALLQQYAEERIMNAPSLQWNVNGNAQRHEVMKAVLMNSADKLIDDGTVMVGGNPVAPGNLLGMTRTVVKQDGTSTWLNSDAYDDSAVGLGTFVPLDEEMGTGHLNASRALTQYQSGEYDSDGADVPVIGWDYDTTTGQGDFNRYRFDSELREGSFISITLAWDRHVAFDTDGGTTDFYDSGDTFEPYVDDGISPPDDSVINDLNLYLMPRNAASITQTIAVSESTVGTVEHLFFQIPETAEYEIWVRQFDQESFSASQNYAVAWWAVGVQAPTSQGDYNGDTVVDINDYNLWRSDFGSTTELDADGNGDNIINAADYVIWRDNLGATFGSGSATAVPEPTSLLLLALAATFFRRRGRSPQTAAVAVAPRNPDKNFDSHSTALPV